MDYRCQYCGRKLDTGLRCEVCDTKRSESMKEKEFLQNVNKLIEMILKNAGHSFGLDFGLINEMGIEVKKRLEIVKED